MSARQSSDLLWEFVPAASRPAAAADARGSGRRVVRFSKPTFDTIAARAPRERAGAVAGTEMTLPLPDGSFGRFAVSESPILTPELAAQFPEIRTFVAKGIDDPSATARFGWTAAGFHSIVLSEEGASFIDPVPGSTTEHYVYTREQAGPRDDGFRCLLDATAPLTAARNSGEFPISHGGTLRTYRLVIAATAEYTAVSPGTVDGAVSRITATMNRVNGVFERDIAVRMIVATGTSASPTALIFTNASTDPYSDGPSGDPSAMLDQNQSTIDSVVGSANYDLGHLFSFNGGGLAALGSPCTSFKAMGVTGASGLSGDAFDIDYVAHEIGHQFGAPHSFNGSTSSCSNRSVPNAYEPGSGVTIMAYAGICSVENLARNSIDQFHVESLNNMTAFITSGTGATCGTPSATGNTPPTVSAQSASYTIPAQTPFTLSANGSDANSDSLTYTWEQYDLGGATNSAASIATDDGSRPLFRSYPATTSNARTFPSLTYILNNANVPPTTYNCSGSTCATGEALPTTTRTMNFKVTARDNRAGGGGIATGQTAVSVIGTAGPFAITSPNTSAAVAGGSPLTVTWNVANTTAAPIGTSHVKISLSSDGGATFPTVLAASTLNDGSETVSMPASAVASARIKVEAVGNIFFDISVGFSITEATTTNTIAVSPSTLNFKGTNNSGTLSPMTPAQTVTVTTSGTGTISWSVAADQPWVQLSRTSGTGNGTFTIGIVNPGNVLGATTNATANVTLTATNVNNSPRVITVNLSLTPATSLAAPFGQVDTPAQNATGIQGAIGVTGWALDDVTVAGVKIYRNCLSFDNPASCQTIGGNSVVFVGDAAFLAGARPDVETAFSSFPNANRAGWGYLMLTPMLPHVTSQQQYGGQGALTLYAYATDQEGNVKLLGRTTDSSNPQSTAATSITMANDTIAKPFGAIDTPSQGQTVSGTLNNFGWALTPDGNTVADGTDILVPTNGSTSFVFIDGAPVAPVAYNQCRGSVGNPVPATSYCDDDVANIFGNPTPLAAGTARTTNPTRHRNLDAGRGAIGAYTINTASLSNGLHTIVWSVTDSANRTEGIGSRFFNVLNGGSRPEADLRQDPARAIGDARTLPPVSDGVIYGRAGFDLRAAWQPIEGGATGARAVTIPELGRLELSLGDEVSSGYLRVGTELRPLPPGSRLQDGHFTWAPGAGYIGTYDLVFAGNAAQIPVTVTIATAPAEPLPAIEGWIDLPRGEATGLFTVAGWAFDRGSLAGAGVGAVHVWAFRKDVAEPLPIFLGAAALHGLRPDVGAVYGTRFADAGWSLTAPALPAGDYELVAYVWSTRTGRFEDARRTSVRVR